ncbi:GlsB/YeaQ/YmgE family stress response membrane protein [Novosphingobium sp. MW5]|nr:GlsB/YeaQ/YmgE family stress response membrane protein [Novosphingobium sp. MW5]
MLNVISYILVGLVVGVLGRFFYPGKVEMGLLWTIVLGIAGSLLAGMVTNRGAPGLNRAGILASILGAIVLIFLGRMLNIGA